ncbi:MAG: hypothetical protein Q8L34_04380 [Candidatus Woesearchaeota archaeon]|nr:hypothetical protein [Candidatus Woesearchaeota archaeon]
MFCKQSFEGFGKMQFRSRNTISIGQPQPLNTEKSMVATAIDKQMWRRMPSKFATKVKPVQTQARVNIESGLRKMNYLLAPKNKVTKVMNAHGGWTITSSQGPGVGNRTVFDKNGKKLRSYRL